MPFKIEMNEELQKLGAVHPEPFQRHPVLELKNRRRMGRPGEAVEPGHPDQAGNKTKPQLFRLLEKNTEMPSMRS